MPTEWQRRNPTRRSARAPWPPAVVTYRMELTELKTNFPGDAQQDRHFTPAGGEARDPAVLPMIRHTRSRHDRRESAEVMGRACELSVRS
jgi:hypothetical protein